MQIATAWFAAAALLISLSALVVSFLAWRTSHRNVSIAVRDEQRRIADRHDACGPTFEPEVSVVYDRAAKLRIRVVGGPGDIAVDVRPANVPWCRGLSSGDVGPVGESVWFPPRESGDVIALTAHLTVDPWAGHTDGVALPLLLDVQSREDPPRRWERRVSVQLMPPPPAPVAVPAEDPVPPSW